MDEIEQAQSSGLDYAMLMEGVAEVRESVGAMVSGLMGSALSRPVRSSLASSASWARPRRRES